MRIYIVSLSSITANEEHLASLFAELPRRCVVLLEDIDTAGLTHTREGATATTDGSASDMVPGQKTPGMTGTTAAPAGRLSLSGLLNILDGVASQEGRVLIMTTNHVEKLDKALIRPGRVDKIVKFGRADRGMTAAIFKAIYRPEGDEATRWETSAADKAQDEKRQADVVAEVDMLADRFADLIPDDEFSPAELQGYLLKHKRDPAGALEGAARWVVLARAEKVERDAEEGAKHQTESEEKELREKEKREKEKRGKEKREKEKREKERAKERRRKSKRSQRKSQKSSGSSSSEADSGGDATSSELEPESEPESESESESNVAKKEGSRAK